MFEWFTIVLISAAAAIKTKSWKYRMLLAITSGIASASIAAVLLVADDPVKKIDKLIIGSIINTIVSVAMIALFVWLFTKKKSKA